MRVPTDEEIEAVQTALDNDGAQIVTIGSQLGQQAAQLVLATAKPIKKLQDKLLKDAAKKIVASDNGIDYLSTSLLNGANTWLQEAEFLLQNLAVKGGMIDPGDPLAEALATEVASEPQIEYLGTLVLAVKEAVPWLDRIAHALERIADSVNPSAALRTQREADTEEAIAEASDYVAATAEKSFTAPLV